MWTVSERSGLELRVRMCQCVRVCIVYVYIAYMSFLIYIIEYIHAAHYMSMRMHILPSRRVPCSTVWRSSCWKISRKYMCQRSITPEGFVSMLEKEGLKTIRNRIQTPWLIFMSFILTILESWIQLNLLVLLRLIFPLKKVQLYDSTEEQKIWSK